MKSLWRYTTLVLALAGVTLIMIPLVLEDTPWPTRARDHLESKGLAESGAINTVSAIYLGYRVFDTLGETIVLLVAITGTIAIMGPSFNHTGVRVGPQHHHRTDLLEVVTGKLGPVVLVFGLYVMLYGHLSPGGGFQGGVVIASGIVFLALGGRQDSPTMLTDPKVLSALEALAFLLMVLAGMSGMLIPGGFFSNTLEPLGLPRVSFIVLLNVLIGIKVGAGMGFMCIAMLGRVIH